MVEEDKKTMNEKRKLALNPEESENLIILDPAPPTKLCFHVEEIIIQCGKLQLKLPKFWDLKDIDEITFQFEDEKYVYVRKGEVEGT